MDDRKPFIIIITSLEFGVWSAECGVIPYSAFSIPHSIHSYLKLSTGFAIAARIACVLTVSSAITSATTFVTAAPSPLRMPISLVRGSAANDASPILRMNKCLAYIRTIFYI
ncbi:MAG: hypothetical protein ACE5IR_28310 [bacterium]